MIHRSGRLLVAIATSLVAVLTATAPIETAGELDARSRALLKRFFHSGTPALVRYSGTRRLQARAERLRREGWIEASTEFDREHGFRYSIIEEGGSNAVRQRVLRAALEAERRSVGDGSGRADLSDANYIFENAQEQADGLVRFPVKPRRRHELLVEGGILVRPGTGDLVEISGRVSKNPSFWTRRVEITRRYGRVAGVRVPLSMESVASVFIAGRSTFSMSYTYREINGRPVDHAAPPPTEPPP